MCKRGVTGSILARKRAGVIGLIQRRSKGGESLRTIMSLGKKPNT